MRVVSAHDLTRVRLCVEPACPNEAERTSTRCREHNLAKPQTRGKHNPWTRADAVGALQALARLLGRCPSSAEIRGRGDLPSAPTWMKLVGSYADYCGAAGFERPSRRGRPRKHPVLEEVASSNLGPADAASSSKRALGTAGTRSGEAEAPAAPNARTARLRVIQRIAAVREEIDAMERELLDALQDEAA